jgi:hypothetical protein
MKPVTTPPSSRFRAAVSVRSTRHRSIVALLAGACIMGSIVPATAGNGDFAVPLVQEPADDPWEFAFIINGWLPWVEITTARGREVDIGLDDIVDAVDMFAEFGVEARKGKWALTADVLYGKVTFRPSGPIIDRIDLKEWIVTPKISYRVAEGDWGHLNVTGGVRYTNLKVDVLGNRIFGGVFDENASGVLWDGLVGINGEYNISERWYMPFTVDVGAGDSDFVSDLDAGIGYRFKYADVILAFRYAYYDFGSSAPLQDETIYGPILKARFTF